MGDRVERRYISPSPQPHSAEVPVFHSSAAASVVGNVWFLVVIVGLGHVRLKTWRRGALHPNP